MSFWQLFLAGLHRQPKEHMPWLQALGAQQQQVKATTQAVRQSVEDLERHLELIARRRLDRRKQ